MPLNQLDYDEAMNLLRKLKEDGPEAAGAERILKRLSEADAEILAASLRTVLKGPDPEWKAVVLKRVVAAAGNELVLDLAPELFALALNATDAEAETGVDELAEQLLNRLLPQ